MAMGTPERLELSHHGDEVDVALRARPVIVHEADEIVSQLWEQLSLASRAAADPVRDAVRTLCIVFVSQAEDLSRTDLYDLRPAFETSVKNILALRIPPSELPLVRWTAHLQLKCVPSFSSQDEANTSAEEPPVQPVSRADRRARLVARIREANAETLERLADL